MHAFADIRMGSNFEDECKRLGRKGGMSNREIEFLRNNWEKRKTSGAMAPYHPYGIDRADRIQKYIDKWDEEHAAN
jgi:hypothetical protein